MTGPYARPLPVAFDLIWTLLAPLHAGIGAGLAAIGVPPVVGDALLEVLLWGEFIAVGYAVLRITRRMSAEPPAAAVTVGAALIAAALFGWTMRSATMHLHELFLRPDHLLLAGALGIAMQPLPAGARRALLAAISATLLVRHYGAFPVAVVAGGGLAGLAAATLIGRDRRRLLVASQLAVVVAIIGLAFWLRSRQPGLAIAIHGLAFFILLRHVSWAVEFAGGVVPNVVDYCHYLLFYPGAAGLLGGPEVFAEFRQRNLLRAPVRPDAQAAMRLVRGALCVWLSRRIPISMEAVAASSEFFAAWAVQATYWIEVALYLMGVWIMVDTIALLLGVRLRQNFAHMLQAENPSDLWRSVRGTMTYWLVYHIYQPLGGNRGSQALHVLAAMAFSLGWHLVGVPFLALPATPMHFVPFTLWATVTAAALVGHVLARQHTWSVLPAATPVPVRRAVHRGLTLLLGSLAVTLPWFQIGSNIGAFVPFVRTIIGWPSP